MKVTLLSPLVLVTLGSVASLSGGQGPKGDPAVEGFVKSIQANRARVTTVTMKMRGRRVDTRGVYTPSPAFAALVPNGSDLKGDYPPTDSTTDVAAEVTIDLPGGKVRNRSTGSIWHLTDKKYNVFDITYFYDGSSLAMQDDKALHVSKGQPVPSVFLKKNESAPMMFSQAHWPIFFPYGRYDLMYDLPTRKDSPLANNVTPEQVRVASKATDGSLAVFELKNQVVEGDKIHVYTLPDDGYRITGAEYRDSRGRALLKADLSYEKSAHKWIPSSWKVDVYNDVLKQWKLAHTYTISMTEAIVNRPVPASEYAPELKPGVLVESERDQKVYRVDQRGELVPVPQSPRQRRNWPLWGAVAGGVVATAVLLLFLFRRRSSPGGLPASTQGPPTS